MLTGKFFQKGQEAKGFFRGYGSFGEICGEVTREGSTVTRETEDYRISCRYEEDKHGVFTREDCFRNISGKPMDLRALKSRFVFDGGEYEVYTQFNTWQSESFGGWQPLTTAVTATGASSRTSQDAIPFMALWSLQEQRGVAFHLLPDSAWQMSVTRAGLSGKYAVTVVELGILDYNFDVTLAPNEEISLPRILCYEFTNKTDMDCWKLHNYMHTHYPRKAMPVIYDTWMYCFDYISCENVIAQIAPAAELGVEYFFIDAGWFGKGKNWTKSVGDWEENTVTGFQGHMIDVANAVRAAGMKFGIWLEPERADPLSDSVRDHPDFYIPGDVEPGRYFLDFANPEARAWMLGVIFDLVDRYGVEYIKDDYNADLVFDPHHTAHRAYHQGQRAFIRAIRERYPNIYLTSCASGGERMDLAAYTQFDSTWPSDNESPYTQFRIYKDTLLRMPPQGFERWMALHSLTGYEDFYKSFQGSNNVGTQRIIACGDAVWKHVEGVHMSWLKGFFTGGPIGLSMDLNLLSPEVRAQLKEFIAGVKANREFWRTAVARILFDTPSATALQYSDMRLSRIVVQLFSHKSQQNSFCLRPVVDESKTYRLSTGKTMTGKEIAREGIEITNDPWFDNWNEMFEVILEEV